MDELESLKGRVEALEKELKSLTLYASSVDRFVFELARWAARPPEKFRLAAPNARMPDGLSPEHQQMLRKVLR